MRSIWKWMVRRLFRNGIHPSRTRATQRIILGVEVLEARRLLAALPPIVVITTADNGNNADPIGGSLRDAINEVNNGKAGSIEFFGLPGKQFFRLRAPLPTITKQVTIDGDNSRWWPTESIVLMPALGVIGADATPLTLKGPGANDSRIYGLTIDGFSDGYGIMLDHVNAVKVGGDTPSLENTFTGNKVGVGINGGNSNIVQNDFIGNTNGQVARGNLIGVLITNGASSNTIGAPTLSLRNVISGNSRDGVEIAGGNNNVIAGNEIGTDIDGLYPLGNGVGVEWH